MYLAWFARVPWDVTYSRDDLPDDWVRFQNLRDLCPCELDGSLSRCSVTTKGPQSSAHRRLKTRATKGDSGRHLT